MKKHLLFCCLFLLALASQAQPPYGGTIFIESDVIGPNDSSALERVTYTGQGSREVYDRRIPGWVTIDAYLYEVVWADGLTSEAQVNPEFGTEAQARVEAEKYAYLIGQLPTCLRTDVDGIWIHQGVNPFGGGNRSILIHTGQSDLYDQDGILEETLVHEASHTSLDAAHAESPGWLQAQNLDGEFISTYARDNPLREDIAESFLLWMAVRYRADRISQANYDLITQTIPNRLAYFDSLGLELFPFEAATTHLPEWERGENLGKLRLYPNPATQAVQLDNAMPGTLSIWNAEGRMVCPVKRVGPQASIELAPLPPGFYWVGLNTGESMLMGRLRKVP